jgi:prophage antirepressor-like protein
MDRRQTNKRGYERDYGLNLVVSLILRAALPASDRFKGAVPADVLEQLEKEGDWPSGVAAAAVERLSNDEQLRQQLREP